MYLIRDIKDRKSKTVKMTAPVILVLIDLTLEQKLAMSENSSFLLLFLTNISWMKPTELIWSTSKLLMGDPAGDPGRAGYYMIISRGGENVPRVSCSRLTYLLQQQLQGSIKTFYCSSVTIVNNEF